MSRSEDAPRSALLVIDVQEDFVEPSGSLAVKGGRELHEIWNTLLKLPFTLKIASKDWHPENHISFANNHEGASPFTSKHTIINPENPDESFSTTLWPIHCVQESFGAEFISELDTTSLDHVILKGQDARLESYSAFGPPFRNPAIGLTELDGILKKMKITHVFVVGLAYGYCVRSTAVDAAELGYKTFVIEDGTKAGSESTDELCDFRDSLANKNVTLIGTEVPGNDKGRSWQDQLYEVSGIRAV